MLKLILKEEVEEFNLEGFILTIDDNHNWKFSTLALHGGDETHYADAHSVPIFATSTFSFPDADTGRKRFSIHAAEGRTARPHMLSGGAGDVGGNPI